MHSNTTTKPLNLTCLTVLLGFYWHLFSFETVYGNFCSSEVQATVGLEVPDVCTSAQFKAVLADVVTELPDTFLRTARMTALLLARLCASGWQTGWVVCRPWWLELVSLIVLTLLCLASFYQNFRCLLNFQGATIVTAIWWGMNPSMQCAVSFLF